MYRGAIACSLLALTITLSACGSQSNDTRDVQAPVSIDQVHWDEKAAQQLRAAITRRAAHGLDHMQFAVDGQAGTAQGDRMLTQSALRYASALARGATDPAKLYEVYTVSRPNPNLLNGLGAALRDGDLGKWLDGLAPQDDGYRALSKAYLALHRPDGAPASAIPDKGEPLKPGADDARVPAIARQLVASDYLDPAAGQGNGYNPAMVAAVKRMQADYGIKPDGVIGSDALEILNLSDKDRARTMAVAMERMRWLEREPAPTRIDVNVAAGRLLYWRDGKVADSRKVVVGEPENETPQLSSPIYRLVANPTWTVPRSIQTKEIAGKGGAYLRRNNMAWKDGWVVQQPGRQTAFPGGSAPAQPRLRPRGRRARVCRDVGKGRRRDRRMAPGAGHRQGDVRQTPPRDSGQAALSDDRLGR